MGWLVRHSLEPTNPFKTHLGKTPSLKIIDIHLTCDIWCIIGSFINQTKFLPKLILCQISLVSSGQPSHKYFKKYFKQNLQVFHKYFANISETEPGELHLCQIFPAVEAGRFTKLGEHHDHAPAI